jgi:phage-related protein
VKTYFDKVNVYVNLWVVKEIQFYRTESGRCPVEEFLEGESLVVLNHAFQKKIQKTPKKEIAIAEARKKDHLLRGNRYE